MERIRFKREYLDLIRRGLKTQTRRAEKDGDYTWVCGYIERPDLPCGYVSAYSEICRADSTRRWVRDEVYEAVDENDVPTEPPTVIKVTSLWRESDVRAIRDVDATAEGFASAGEFVEAWRSIYPHTYTGWVIEFEVVGVTP